MALPYDLRPGELIELLVPWRDFVAGDVFQTIDPPMLKFHGDETNPMHWHVRANPYSNKHIDGGPYWPPANIFRICSRLEDTRDYLEAIASLGGA